MRCIVIDLFLSSYHCFRSCQLLYSIRVSLFLGGIFVALHFAKVSCCKIKCHLAITRLWRLELTIWFIFNFVRIAQVMFTHWKWISVQLTLLRFKGSTMLIMLFELFLLQGHVSWGVHFKKLIFSSYFQEKVLLLISLLKTIIFSSKLTH